MNIPAILSEDAKAIYIGNLSTVDADLTLPLKGRNGSDISWKSSHPYTVGEDGKVVRPHAGTGNREVTLTARLSCEGETFERPFTITVLARDLGWTAVRLLPAEGSRLPGAVIAEKAGGGFASLPVRWESPPDMSVPGVYRVAGAPPLEKQPELIPQAVIRVEEEWDAAPLDPPLTPFPYGKVGVNGGVFAENKRRMLEYLLSVNDDSMLYNFRQAAGLDVKGAPPLTGWDAPECLLKGHTTGHYLSALALAFCCGEDAGAYRDKIRYMVSGLAECQKAMGESGRFHEGFLSGYPEEQFDLLERFVPYPQIWAPYYTLHKIMAGLLDCCDFAGEAEALAVAERLGLWVYRRLSACGEETRRKMWAMYIAGEYGGMNEAMARLHRLSPKPEYLQAARFFDNDPLFYPMERNIDVLPGIHGNQHIPQMVGALEMYGRTGEARYYGAALNFYRMVSRDHIYSIGGVGEREMFREAGKIAALLTDKTAESCASYNMLKLTARLFAYSGDPGMADYYERTLYNHIAATHDQSGPTGGSTYFMPLLPGSEKEYDTGGNSCCHGTGLENHLKYQEMIFHHAGDTLYVTLFIPSVLDWTEKGVRVTLRDGYLEREAAEITVEGDASFGLRLRVPGWLEKPARLFVNGAETEYEIRDGYAVVDCKGSCDIRWSTPFPFRFEPAPDDPAVGSILYGPLVMAADSGAKDFLPIGGETPERTEEPLTFTCGGYTLRPGYALWNRPYHIYVRKF